MTEKEINIDKLSKNYGELDTEGKDTLLKIGEKIFNVNNFVDKKISYLKEKTNELKFNDKKPV